MRSEAERRRDPLAGVEPVEELGLTAVVAGLARRGTERRSPVRPAERRRRERQVSVTFSDAEIPRRLRALARRWGMVAPDGRSAGLSAVVEVLVVPALEEAEKGLGTGGQGGGAD